MSEYFHRSAESFGNRVPGTGEYVPPLTRHQLRASLRQAFNEILEQELPNKVEMLVGARTEAEKHGLPHADAEEIYADAWWSYLEPADTEESEEEKAGELLQLFKDKDEATVENHEAAQLDQAEQEAIGEIPEEEIDE